MWLLVGGFKIISKPLNKSYLSKDGVIHSIYSGDQSASTVGQEGIKISQIINRQQQKGRPILILSDISKIGEINLGARKAGLQLFRELEYEKLAIIGVTFLTQKLVNAVVIASGRGFKIKTFESKNEAKRWLLS